MTRIKKHTRSLGVTQHLSVYQIHQNCLPTFKFGTDICQFFVYPLNLCLFTFTCKNNKT